MFITKPYQDLWKAIIRPPRDIYTLDQLACPRFINGFFYVREDFTLQNKRNATIQCSRFKRSPVHPPKPMPCVIYLHGNCSSRREAVDCLCLLQLNMTIVCFDFCGCGLSDGEYVSLGWHERDDLEAVVNHLRKDPTISTIGLWGRSMGAVTALLHGDKDPSIAGMVLDSPFYSMRALCEELACSWRLPKFVVSMVMKMLAKTVKEKAQFNIDELEPIQHVDKTFIPALFIAANEDTFIQPHHSDKLAEKFSGDSELIKVEGDHNSQRSPEVLTKIAQFFMGRLWDTANILEPPCQAPQQPLYRPMVRMPIPIESRSTSVSNSNSNINLNNNNNLTPLPQRGAQRHRRSEPSASECHPHAPRVTHLADMRPPDTSSAYQYGFTDPDEETILIGSDYISALRGADASFDDLQLTDEERVMNVILLEQLREKNGPRSSS